MKLEKLIDLQNFCFSFKILTKLKMFLVKKNFINLKEEKIQDKYKILILCLMPVFLIVGTAVSELAIISLCLIFIYEFFIKNNCK